MKILTSKLIFFEKYFIGCNNITTSATNIIGAPILFIGACFAGALLAGGFVLIMMFYVAYTAYNELKTIEKIDIG
ncbi:hypothetical protein [Brumimicrobium mesophilum]|uniref:hypothetical protein n=1 Tax=Brumimicrobium mesophilum TaxID=392717 RepID=UPI000D1446D4|nr:hypothetical protein [Brumimicrobium mesophilum]